MLNEAKAAMNEKSRDYRMRAHRHGHGPANMYR